MAEEYSLKFQEGWDTNLRAFDAGVQQRILRKIQKLKHPLAHRHLKHGLQFFVAEVGGYRIAFQADDNLKVKSIRFVGTHKQYQNWYSEL